MKKKISLFAFSLLVLSAAFLSSCNKDEPAPPPSCENFAVVVAQQGNNQLSANATGGTTPYSYLWTSGSVEQVVTLDSSFIGDYGVTVTDANGCTAENTFSITLDPCASFLASISITNNTLTASQSGGTAPFTYLWGDGATSAALTIDPSVAATYSVTIKDANNCTSSTTYSVSTISPCDSSGLAITYSYSNSALIAAGTGGLAPYSFLWNNGSTSDILSNVTSGTYSTTITDANGCTASSEFTVTTCADFSVVIAQNDSITTAIFFDAQTNGGTNPLTYNWDGIATGTESFIEVPNGTSGSISVTVTDATGCTAQDTKQF